MQTLSKLDEDVLAYYIESPEGPDQVRYWLGLAMDDLGLNPDEFVPANFYALLKAQDPATWESLQSRFSSKKDARSAGVDVTFTAPKDVSVLYAMTKGNEEMRMLILQAHDKAVATTMKYLDENWTYARSGKGGTTPIKGKGISAAFRHTVNRSVEPDLHTHNVVMNVVLCEDGQWRARDTRFLFKNRQASVAIYEAELRRNIADLGFRWERMESGKLGIVGMSRNVAKGFSQRTALINAELAKMGHPTKERRKRANFFTRKRKASHPVFDDVADNWADTMRRLGEDPKTFLHRVLAMGGDIPNEAESVDWRTDQMVRMLGPDGISATKSVFYDADILAYWGNAAVNGCRLAEMQECASLSKMSPDIIGLDLIDQKGRVLNKENRGNTPVALDFKQMNPDNTPVEVRVRSTYTTSAILEAERIIYDLAETSFMGEPSAPKVDRALVEAAISAKSNRSGIIFSSEQLAFMRGTLSSGRSVELVRGVAGAGKTTQLEVVSSAFKQAGYSVIGCSPTGVAADNLQRGARIESHTLASLALQVQSTGLPANCVLIVDEAGMADTRTLCTLMTAATKAGAKVILVGDDRQLPSVSAGGMYGMLYRYFKHKGQCYYELQENRRQYTMWAKDIAAALRLGQSEQAAALFAQYGNVVLDENEQALAMACVSGWLLDRARLYDTVMLGWSNDDIDLLNLLARQSLIASGKLHPEAEVELDASRVNSTLGMRTYCVGEEIIFTASAQLPTPQQYEAFYEHSIPYSKNSRVRVRNSETGTIRSLVYDADGWVATIRMKDGRWVVAQEDTLRDGTNYSYARTVHKAQGETIGQVAQNINGTCHVFRPERFAQELIYTAATRATTETMLYVNDTRFVTSAEPFEFDDDVVLGAAPYDALEKATRSWRTPGAETTVLGEVSRRSNVELLSTTASLQSLRHEANNLRARVARAHGWGGSDLVAKYTALRDYYGLVWESGGDETTYDDSLIHEMGLIRDYVQTKVAMFNPAPQTDLIALADHLSIVEAALERRRTTEIKKLVQLPPDEILCLLGAPGHTEAQREAYRECIANIVLIREQFPMHSRAPVASSTLSSALTFDVRREDLFATAFAPELEGLADSLTRLRDAHLAEKSRDSDAAIVGLGAAIEEIRYVLSDKFVEDVAKIADLKPAVWPISIGGNGRVDLI